MKMDRLNNSFPPASAVEGIKSVRCVCLAVRQLVSVAEQFELELAVAMCEMSVLEGLWGKNTDKQGVAGGRVNAQAFSFHTVKAMPTRDPKM